MGGTGQEPFLTDEAEEQVAEEVATGRFRTAGEIRDWIAEQYGITYKTSSIYSLMSRLKCGPKVPRPMHAKADQEQQASWKKGGSSRLSRKLE
jgi:transposase